MSSSKSSVPLVWCNPDTRYAGKRRTAWRTGVLVDTQTRGIRHKGTVTWDLWPRERDHLEPGTRLRLILAREKAIDVPDGRRSMSPIA